MKYSKEFNALIGSTTENYIGHGNPNAKILFLGQEGASNPEASLEEDGRNDYLRSIKGNREDWSRNIHEGIGYDNLPECCTPSTLKSYNPLYPYKGQKFQVRSGSDEAGNLKGAKGTARTWYNYQKLINRIFELLSAERKPMTKDDDIDFHLLSFHSDMSAVASMKHKPKNEDGAESVIKRVSLLSSDFFRNFPIVIAAVGHFPRETYGNSYFGDIFGVEFLGNEETERDKWMNVSVRNDDAHTMLLIHTPQFSYSELTDNYFDQIASRVVEFAREHNINLLPEE